MTRYESPLLELRIHGRRFLVENTGEVFVPRKYLTGFLLSDIPNNIVIRPPADLFQELGMPVAVVSIPPFHGRGQIEATIHLEEHEWTRDIGLTKYRESLIHAVKERKRYFGDVNSERSADVAPEFVAFQVLFTENIEVGTALLHFEHIVQSLIQRAQSLSSRRIDPLVGLPDRGAFDHDLKHFVELGSVALIMADIDHFKDINDRYLHTTGDAVLREFATLVSTKTKDKGFAYRYGGEEIAILIPKSGTNNAQKIAKELRRAIKAHVFPQSIKLTCSFGVSADIRDSSQGKDLLEEADQALYEAKRAGRDRVVVWHP